MQPRLDGSDRNGEGRRDLGQRHTQVVVQDNDRPAAIVEVPENPVDQLTIGVGVRAVRCGRSVDRRELDLDQAPTATSDLVEAGIDGETTKPGFEPIGIPKLREVPPGPDERLLDRVACELRVPKDEASDLVQPHDGRARELGKGVMIASPRPLDDPSLVHARLVLAAQPQGRAS